MNVTRKEQRIIQRALNAWQASGELTPSDSQRLGFSSPAAGDAVALQHRGDFVFGRRLYRRGAMAAWRTAG